MLYLTFDVCKGRRLQNAPVKPVRCWFWVSGFSFSRSSVLTRVPYDPHLAFLFFGEETSMTVRLFTHGYDFYCPTINICFHLWRRNYRPLFREVKLPDEEEKRLERISRLRVRLTLGMSCGDASTVEMEQAQQELDGYGLGSERTVADYCLQSGVNVLTGNASAAAGRGGLSQHVAFYDESLGKIMQLIARAQGPALVQEKGYSVVVLVVLLLF